MSIHLICETGDLEELQKTIAYLTEIEGPVSVQIAINEKNKKKYSALHCAIFSRNLEIVNFLITNGADVNLKCFGSPPTFLALYAAAQPESYSFGFECFKLLIAHSDANPFAKDDNGMTILHLAASYNFSAAIEVIFTVAEAKDMVNVVSKSGYSALHYAAKHDSVDAANLLIENNSSLTKKCSMSGSTALHIAAINGASGVYKRLLASGAVEDAKDNYGRSAKEIINSRETKLAPKTAIVYSPHCFRHFTCAPEALEDGSAPPENVHRLEVLIDDDEGVLRSTVFKDRLEFYPDSQPAPISDIVRVHEWSYIQRVEKVCSKLPDEVEAEEHLGSLDGDTSISKGTYLAALSAAGAVCEAVDRVINGKAKNAFCPVRPPGHHAGPRGAVAADNGSMSHGFCIFNNVSVGAAYALNRYRDIIKRVAIVDFDVHHGNGTEETIRWLKPGIEKCSVECDLVSATMLAPRYKPWFGANDCDNVLFVSVHGYGPRARGLEYLFPASAFYPGSGATKIPEFSAKEAKNVEKFNEPLILDIGVPLGPSNGKDMKGLEELKTRFQWRNYFRDDIFPKLVEFRPDLILISAGFDAHKKDTINAGYISIIEDDYHWVTEKLSEIANAHCGGRVVSVLEGGYQLGGEYSSAFAKSVVAHVLSLANSDCCTKYSEVLSRLEQESENKYIEKLLAAIEKEMESERMAIEVKQSTFESDTQEIKPISNDVNPNNNEEDLPARKRRRPAVDYAALDRTLRQKEQSPDSNAKEVTSSDTN